MGKQSFWRTMAADPEWGLEGFPDTMLEHLEHFYQFRRRQSLLALVSPLYRRHSDAMSQMRAAFESQLIVGEVSMEDAFSPENYDLTVAWIRGGLAYALGMQEDDAAVEPALALYLFMAHRCQPADARQIAQESRDGDPASHAVAAAAGAAMMRDWPANCDLADVSAHQQLRDLLKHGVNRA